MNPAGQGGDRSRRDDERPNRQGDRNQRSDRPSYGSDRDSRQGDRGGYSGGQRTDRPDSRGGAPREGGYRGGAPR
ncbi:RNA helicase, partial [Micromonospora sp. NPDC049679]